MPSRAAGITIRPYASQDRARCDAIFARNSPRFFAPGEAADFARFLDELRGPYFVACLDDVVVGCGGHLADRDASVGVLTWGMVDLDLVLDSLERG